MSTVMRLWFLALFLVHHATPAPSLFGCIKGIFCSGPVELTPQQKMYQEFSFHPELYETVGFIPTERTVGQFRYLNSHLWLKSDLPLGPGIYMVGESSTAYKMITERIHAADGAICSVHVRKDKIWPMVYVPGAIWVYRSNNQNKEAFPLVRSPDNLEVYLKTLANSGKEYSGAVVTQWNYDQMSASGGFSYIMKIPQSLLDYSVVNCRRVPRNAPPKNIDLKWEKKFRGEWKLSNFQNPMDTLTEYRESGKRALSHSQGKRTAEQGTQTEEGTMGDDDAKGEKQSILDVPE